MLDLFKIVNEIKEAKVEPHKQKKLTLKTFLEVFNINNKVHIIFDDTTYTTPLKLIFNHLDVVALNYEVDYVKISNNEIFIRIFEDYLE